MFRATILNILDTNIAKERYIDTRFWDDNYIIKLDPVEKLLFLYFLTNPLTNIAGIYEISTRRIAFDTGIDTEMILNILKRFELDKKIFYKDGWLIICNFPKYQKYERSPRIKDGITLILNQLPDTLRNDILTLSIPYAYPPPYYNTNYNTNRDTNTNSKEFTSLSYLEKIPESDIKELTEKFVLTEKQLKSKIEDLKNYCEAHGKKYKNYKAFLLNALKKDFQLREKEPFYKGRRLKKEGDLYILYEENKRIEIPYEKIEWK